MVATFHLTLTPYQDLVRANQLYGTNVNISRKSKEFLKLLDFRRNFTIRFKNYSFPIIKLISKQLVCFDGRALKSGEYQLDNRTGGVFENKTGKFFSVKCYSILERGCGNITICCQLVLSGCNEGYAYVPLHRNEYVILSNLSLYHNITNRLFEFGTYQIRESLNEVNGDIQSNVNTNSNQDPIEISIFPRNPTVVVCLPSRTTYNHSNNQTNNTQPKFQISYGLRILTLIGLSISVLWLLLLLITYAMFEQLRTVPGMNMMNIRFSLLVALSLWLFYTGLEQYTRLCNVVATLLHYLNLVSFFVLSAISHHLCHVISKPFLLPNTKKRHQTFIKYSTVVWLGPAMLVAISIVLDKTGEFTVNYGKKCWLGTRDSELYLFILPIGLLVLFNVFAFIRTAVVLSGYHKGLNILQKKRRQNLLICVKLSTLVGFPWLIPFLGVFYHNLEAIQYLNVVFTSFQELYIGMVFSCNKKFSICTRIFGFKTK